MRIAVDAMGGDHAPAHPVDGAVAAARHLGIGIDLVGREEAIRAELTRLRKGLFTSNSGRVTLALGLRGPQYSSLDCTESDVRLARELDLHVSVHGGSAGWGRNRPVGRMHERGLLKSKAAA